MVDGESRLCYVSSTVQSIDVLHHLRDRIATPNVDLSQQEY